MARRVVSPWKRAIAASVGVVLGAMLMGGVASSRDGDIVFGSVAGGVLVGMLFDGLAIGTVGTAAPCAVLCGLLGCMVGPGVDDYDGHCGILMALFGAFVGWQLRGPCRKVEAVPRPTQGEEFSSHDL